MTATAEGTLTLPYNLEAERVVLGGLLLDPDAIQRVVPLLKGEDFYLPDNAIVYNAVLAVFERKQPCDILTVCDELGRKNNLDRIGGRDAIVSFLSAASSSANIEYHAGIVARFGTLRSIIKVGNQISEIGHNVSLDGQEALNAAQQAIHSISRTSGSKDFVRVGEILSEYMNGLEALQDASGGTVGVPTGFTDLDNLTGGLQASDLIILAARPGTGKSALSLCMAYNAAKEGKTVAIFNMEMPAKQLMQRMLSIETGIDAHRLRTGLIQDDEWGRIAQAFGRMSELNIYIDDTPAISLMDVRAKTRRLQEEVGLDFVQIDYLQLMQSGRKDGNRLQEVSEISRGLKGLARELDVPVLAMAQLSRSVESRTSHVPMLSDLRESGTIEQDADIVAFIYREEMYDPNTEKKGLAELHVAKHRNGPLGIVNLRFFDKTTKFANLEMYRNDESQEYSYAGE